ncbi:Hint domain-containing protein [Streptomyces sp. NPDC048272]|uniref:Hint domain-containing protein n=1 Tax=Streptomyces sp. NPDC048272 TaxID=3154616 RepID=UPI0034386654
MPTPAEEAALAYYIRQQRIVRRAAEQAQRAWRLLDLGHFDESWQAAVSAGLVGAISAGQTEAAAGSDAYVAAVLAASGLDSDPAGRVDAAAFAGVAADGRPLKSLAFESALEARWLLEEAGRTEIDAMIGGLEKMLRAASTEVADAGRTATGASIAGNRTINGYIRVVNPPACARCIILAGKEYGWNAGFQRHPKCFPAGVIVSGPASRAASRRWFEGELVVLTTASGQNLSLTGNHPVLTGRGWVPANLLQEGDEVVRSTRPEGATPLVVPDHHEVPSLIEDVWRAFSVNGLDRMPTSTEDFHGDGQQGEVDVVYADRALADSRVAASSEQLVQLRLASGLSLAGEFDFQRAAVLLDLWDSAHARGAVGRSGLGFTFLGAELGGSDHASRAGAPALHSRLNESPGDHIPGDAVLLAERKFAGPAEVSGHDVGHGEIAGLPRWDAPGGAFSVETRDGYASRGRDLLNRLAGQVELDRIVELRRVEWSGHVYSLTSVEGWHSANSLIVSNCDCVHMPAKLIKRGRHHPGVFDSKAYFGSLSPAEQNRIFTHAGAQAIRDGASISSVVNARRGIYTANAYGRSVRATRDAATRRGAWFRAERQRAIQRGLVPPSGRGFRLTSPRLRPEEIYNLAGSRSEVIAMLHRFGYMN